MSMFMSGFPSIYNRKQTALYVESGFSEKFFCTVLLGTLRQLQKKNDN